MQRLLRADAVQVVAHVQYKCSCRLAYEVAKAEASAESRCTGRTTSTAISWLVRWAEQEHLLRADAAHVLPKLLLHARMNKPDYYECDLDM